jgi:hypothetical protein
MKGQIMAYKGRKVLFWSRTKQKRRVMRDGYRVDGLPPGLGDVVISRVINNSTGDSEGVFTYGRRKNWGAFRNGVILRGCNKPTANDLLLYLTESTEWHAISTKEREVIAELANCPIGIIKGVKRIYGTKGGWRVMADDMVEHGPFKTKALAEMAYRMIVGAEEEQS